MKTDLLITPFNIKHLTIEHKTKNELKTYLNEELSAELNKVIREYPFENIYVHISNKNLINTTSNVVFYNNLAQTINQDIKNNFFWYNCFSAKFFAPNDNIFSRFCEKLDTHGLIACPSTRSHNNTTNLDDSIDTLKLTTNFYNQYLKNNDYVSTDYYFTNFSFCLINIKIVKKIQFANNLKYNDEFIIDFFYRLKSHDISVLTDFNSLIFNNKLKDNPVIYNHIQNNIKKIWTNDFLSFDDYKKVYSYQFSSYFMKLKVKNLNITENQAIMYVTTPFNWVNGMTKHVKDLIKLHENKHIYVFETPDDPTENSTFRLHHFYNNVLLDVEKYEIFDFNHIQTMTSKKYDNVLSNILTSKNISVVHIHILALGHKLNFATICKNLGIKTILSIHDLYYIGGEYTQLNVHSQFDEKILKEKYAIKDLDKFKADWNTNIQNLFDDVDKIIFFTTSYYDIFSKFYKISKNKCELIEHGSDYVNRYKLANTQNNSSTFNLIYFGRIREEKGILNLIDYAKNINNINIYVVGTKDDRKLLNLINKTKNIKYISAYNSFEELATIIKKLNIHAKIIPANWHEAFNFTLSEAILLGLYPIVFDFGALGSRLRDYKIGTILKDETCESLESEINRLRNMNSNEWIRELDKVNNTHISTTKEMFEHYQTLYSTLDNHRKCNDLKINYELQKILYDDFSKQFAYNWIKKINKFIWTYNLSNLHGTIKKVKRLLFSK